MNPAFIAHLQEKFSAFLEQPVLISATEPIAGGDINLFWSKLQLAIISLTRIPHLTDWIFLKKRTRVWSCWPVRMRCR
jgi:hypothetical protein